MAEMKVLKKRRRVGEDLAERCWMIVSDGDKLHSVVFFVLNFNYVVGSTQIEGRASKKQN